MTVGNGLNTLEYADRLIKAGVPEEQAKAQALTLYEIINSSLATKRDIEEFKAITKRDIKDIDLKIEQVRADLKKDIKTLEDKISLKLLVYSSGVIGGCGSLILGGIFAMAKLGLLSIQ